MYKLCKTDQSARRQRELEQGLLEAMLTQRYESISVSDLCSQLEIPRKTFYRYFDSKDGALYGLIDHSLLEYASFDTESRKNGKQNLQRELELFFLFWRDNKALLDALHNSGLSGILMERAIQFALNDALPPNRFFPEDTNRTRRHVTIFSVCGLLSMVLTWHYEGFQDSVEELSEAAARLMSKPLFINNGL